jgi:hypothetical protein
MNLLNSDLGIIALWFIVILVGVFAAPGAVYFIAIIAALLTFAVYWPKPRRPVK